MVSQLAMSAASNAMPVTRPVGGADGLDRFGRVADIGGNHRRAFARQRLAVGAAQAPPAAGDDGDLPFKL